MSIISMTVDTSRLVIAMVWTFWMVLPQHLCQHTWRDIRLAASGPNAAGILPRATRGKGPPGWRSGGRRVNWSPSQVMPPVSSWTAPISWRDLPLHRLGENPWQGLPQCPEKVLNSIKIGWTKDLRVQPMRSWPVRRWVLFLAYDACYRLLRHSLLFPMSLWCRVLRRQTVFFYCLSCDLGHMLLVYSRM